MCFTIGVVCTENLIRYVIETVSRSLTKLKRRGVVSIGKLDEIYIDDVCRLFRLTGTHLTRGQSCSS